MSSRIEIKLPSDMEFLGIPDAILTEIGGDRECDKQLLEELSTSVIEACTNAMEHGNKLEEETPIEIIFECNEEMVTVTVYDRQGRSASGTREVDR